MNLDQLALKNGAPKFSKKELLGLERYDAMLLAIAECQQIDEVKDIHDKARALEVYANEAKNFESELRALDIRLRASRRAGELIHEGQKSGTIAMGGRPRKVSEQTTLIPKGKKPKTLEQFGITRDQSSYWKELAGIPEEEFEEEMPTKTRKRTSPEKMARKRRKKRKKPPDPEKVRARVLYLTALRVWGRVRDVPGLLGGEPLAIVVGVMDRQFVDDLTIAVPKAIEFLESLRKELKNANPQK